MHFAVLLLPTGRAGVFTAAAPLAVRPNVHPDLVAPRGTGRWMANSPPALYVTRPIADIRIRLPGLSEASDRAIWPVGVSSRRQSVLRRSPGGPILPWAWSSFRSAGTRLWVRPEGSRASSEPSASGAVAGSAYPLMGFAGDVETGHTRQVTADAGPSTKPPAAIDRRCQTSCHRLPSERIEAADAWPIRPGSSARADRLPV